ncbi:hypothetical protein ElyMa_001944300 [Elysia marginata]|uniref:Uncharacterized protein n=1 Tax=Elysia marginata TaxID=1093978 RepID=A0AAV4EVV3_9GAST|nr:hypothetical protein ElyMa_001944300 [Elysia marginata]
MIEVNGCVIIILRSRKLVVDEPEVRAVRNLHSYATKPTGFKPRGLHGVTRVIFCPDLMQQHPDHLRGASRLGWRGSGGDGCGKGEGGRVEKVLWERE